MRKALVLLLPTIGITLWLLPHVFRKQAVLGPVHVLIHVSRKYNSALFVQGMMRMGRLHFDEHRNVMQGKVLLSYTRDCFYCERHWQGEIVEQNGTGSRTQICGTFISTQGQTVGRVCYR